MTELEKIYHYNSNWSLLRGTGGVPFLLVKKDIMDVAILSPYYPICICFLAIVAYLLIRSVAIMESYELLVENE